MRVYTIFAKENPRNCGNRAGALINRRTPIKLYKDMEDFMKILRADQQQRKQEQARMGEVIRQHTETVNRMALNLGYIAQPICKPVTGLGVFINCSLN